MRAPLNPIGRSAPDVVSRMVWCSISALSSAPTRTAQADSHIHVIRPIAAPNEP